MNNFNLIIERLEEALSIHYPSLLHRLKKGIAEEKVLDYFKHIGLSPNRSLVDLYKWKDGVEGNEETKIKDLILFPLGIFNSLDLAIEEYDLYAVQNNFWPKGLFPLFSSNCGDFVLLNLNNQDYKEYALYKYSPALLILTPELFFNSLDIFLKAITECYNKEAYMYNNGLAVNYHKEELIFKALN